MPSLFPQLFDFQFFVPFFIRVTLGILFLSYSYAKLFRSADGFSLFGYAVSTTQKRGEKLTALFELFIAGLLILGLFTQAAALLVLIYVVVGATIMRQTVAFSDRWQFSLAIFVLALSLFVMGAGAFAIDYPF